MARIIDGVRYDTFSVERFHWDLSVWGLTSCQDTGSLDCQQFIDDHPDWCCRVVDHDTARGWGDDDA